MSPMSSLFSRRSAQAPQLLTAPLPRLTLGSLGVKDQDPDAKGICDTAKNRCPSEVANLYEIGELLGSGTMAAVRRATRRSDGHDVALKRLKSTDVELRAFTRTEFELMQGLTHDAIVRVETFHECESDVWICMELCTDGSVGAFVEKHGALTEHVARLLFCQLLDGVNYLHQKRVVHRDIKPENLLLCSGAQKLKITDFNSAKQIGGSMCSLMLTDRGTRQYSAPELRFGQHWNERVDIWASGLCLYFMLRSVLPFDIQRQRVAAVLMSGRLPTIEWDTISDLVKNLVQQCLTVDMCDRPPAMELLQHRALTQDPGIVDGVQHAEAVGLGGHGRSSFFVLLSISGLTSLYPRQQHLLASDCLLRTRSGTDEESPKTPCANLDFTSMSVNKISVNDCKERRDGKLQLRRLAENKLARSCSKDLAVGRTSSNEVPCLWSTWNVAVLEEPDSPPPVTRSFTRATLQSSNIN